VKHPGFVATRFGNQSGALLSRLVWPAKFVAIASAKGAETIVYLASSLDVAEASGQYFFKSAPTTPSSRAHDDRSAVLLWQRSVDLAGSEEYASFRARMLAGIETSRGVTLF
jgi:hypothetical protein